ncbi:hypothetical protein [Caulobacter endophyticus]|uniref:DUF805 domain-containing protein n=1 Tax=Caulobacter endophyticus TaxID=2172652 RepID=A0A2T9K4N8_9CAUL|nr:hypothetical protein [Caulobacter endophyticus]PVM90763.1 hypothetical protein DDF67_10100 [Caulobacter endophyticus]
MDAIRNYLLGRCRRLEYWITVGALIGCHLGLRFVTDNAVLVWLLIGAWFLLASRRFRDIGWPVWFCLAPIPVLLALIAAAFVIGVDLDRPGQTAILNTLPVAMIILWLGFWLTIGVWRSKPSTLPTPRDQAEVFG